jgi:hypothetical protein
MHADRAPERPDLPLGVFDLGEQSAWRRRHQHRARQARQRWNLYAETTP